MTANSKRTKPVANIISHLVFVKPSSIWNCDLELVHGWVSRNPTVVHSHIVHWKSSIVIRPISMYSNLQEGNQGWQFWHDRTTKLKNNTNFSDFPIKFNSIYVIIISKCLINLINESCTYFIDQLIYQTDPWPNLFMTRINLLILYV